ncbi:DNA endonuclease SmrA [Pseudidiomarina gelatinasegens]|jgi:DNA-nicking Smr family endonuclease|uniref:DNA endonuclease SmrA n=1 Tax=Pseudidiomarina gelatinasegens TaxID=2487740 RepID=A0A443Z7F8_9GAMM|nr:DNA endonuclease SmrA [Pseudidiomarina gelatinasegens]RWU12840.1 DNA endonuclease SmrA [Pseudidiomarina gelatinasegens]
MSDDFELFRSEMTGVTPLAGQDVADIRTAFAPTLAQQERRKAAEQQLEEDINFLSTEYVDLVEPSELLAFKRDGVQHGVYKRLRLGQYPLDASLNLHNHSLRQARVALFEFIQDCHASGVRSALIIHGQGKHSKPHPALIKSYVNKWLRELEPVMAFHSAQRHHGGSGALYLMLRKNANQKQLNRERHQRR